LATYETFTGRSTAAIDHLREFKALAERAQEWSMLPDALRLMALARIYVGELREGGEMLEHLATRFSRAETRAMAARFAVDRYCIIRSSLAFARWLQGRTSAALAASQEAVEAAIAIAHPVSHSNSLAFAQAPLALWTGDLDKAAAALAAMRGNLAIRNTAVWRRFIRFFDAALRHARGDRRAVEEMADALDDLLGTGFNTRAAMYLAMLAEALLREGRVVEAALRIDQAAAWLSQHQERWCAPEVERIRGLIQLAEGDAPAAEACLRLAVDDARRQGALAFELRAAVALARLLAAAGREDAARAALEPAVAAFIEPEGNAELAEARILLSTLT
jgi:hypothetical protein